MFAENLKDILKDNANLPIHVLVTIKDEWGDKLDISKPLSNVVVRDGKIWIIGE